MPEEINRATREKKAIAKAAKTPSGPLWPYPPPSPYFSDVPMFEGPYISGPMSSPMAGRPSNFAHRRSVSVPNLEVTTWLDAPSAPQLQSPAMFESPQWMYNGGWSPAQAMYSTPQTSPYPSVLENHMSVTGDSTPSSHTPFTPLKVDDMPPLPAAWSTPNLHQHPSLPQMTTSSPVSPYYTPYPTPYRHGAPQPIYKSPVVNLNADISPTLAPEMSDSMSGKELVGLGLGVPTPNVDVFGPTTMLSDDYFAAQAGY